MNNWIYDIEMYPNLFLIGAKIPGTDVRVRFQVSPLADDRSDLAQWLLNDVEKMIGFNNLSYDSPMLYKLIHHCTNCSPWEAVDKLYQYSQFLIKKTKYPPNICPIRTQIDLFKINHFDNKARMTSLKLLEFNLRLKNLQSLPYPFDKVLTKEEIWRVVDYNDNDVDATEQVYYETLSEINLREKMSPKYGIDFTNFNSTKMGEHILISKITEKLGKEVLYNKIIDNHGEEKWVIRNTKRKFIDLSEVVFDYITFETAPFQAISAWFKSRIIPEVKGVFSEIPFSELVTLEPHYEVKVKKKTQKDLNVVYRGTKYVFGSGGIHACAPAGIYQGGNGKLIRDIDVASYYPNLSIENDFYPEHIGPEFCVIYKDMYIERQGYSKSTHKSENLILKLGLNGSYGKSNSIYSALYDPKYTMLTTVNGQLLLCMTAEQLMERVPGCEILQVNTDGLTIRFDDYYDKLVNSICREWERKTKLKLEDAYYSKMIIKDVNNYLGLFNDGKVKRKGAAFIHKIQPGELELHKNFSHLVIPKALEAYFIYSIDPEEFIKNHNDIYDFFLRTKIPKTSRLELRDYDNHGFVSSTTLGQNISRYLVTGKYTYDKIEKMYSKQGVGMTMMKVMPPLAKNPNKEREINVEADWLCTVVNTLPDDLNTLKSLIDYDYYLKKIYDVIYTIEGKPETK